MSAALSLSRLAILTIAALLAWRVIHVNGVLYDDNGRPRLAPFAAAAGGNDKAALQGILHANPAEVAALLMLARELDREGDADSASRAYASALQVAPLDRGALALATEHFMRRGDARGIGTLDRLVAHYAEAREAAFAMLATAIASGTQREEIAALVARNPAWLGAFVVDACARGADLSVLMPALLRRSASGAAPLEAGCAIERLRAAGRWEQAYQLWLNSLPRARLAEVGFVFNGGFEFAASGTAFDWKLQESSGRQAGHAADFARAQDAAGKRALRVAYTGGRQSGVPIQQFLALPAGSYELTGLARPEGIKSPRGIRWTVRCAQPADARPLLAASERFVGSSEWRRFSMAVRIPEACPGQLLRLEPAGEEGALAFIGGTAWFDEIRLLRR